jgi:hypothetical protein
MANIPIPKWNRRLARKDHSKARMKARRENVKSCSSISALGDIW